MTILEDNSFPKESDFHEKIDQLIKDEIRNRHRLLTKMSADLKKKNEHLENLVFELQREKNFFEHRMELEIQKAQKEAKENAFRELTGGLTFGEEIWICSSNPINITCPDCHGKKCFEVVIPDPKTITKKLEINCPTCIGIGHLIKFTSVPAKVWAESFEIKKSGVNLKGNCRTSMFVNVPVSECYKTKEECQLQCDLLNEKRESEGK